MQTFNQLFFKKKQIFSYFFKEISDNYIIIIKKWFTHSHIYNSVDFFLQ